MLLLLIIDARIGIRSLRRVCSANHRLCLVDVALLGCAHLVDYFDEPSVEDFAHNLQFLLGHISGARELLALTDLGVYGRPNLAGVAPEEGAQLLGSRDDCLGCLVVFNILGEFCPSRLVVVVFHKNHSCFGTLDDFLLPVFFVLPRSFVRVRYRIIN